MKLNECLVALGRNAGSYRIYYLHSSKQYIASIKWIRTPTTFVCPDCSDEEALYRCCTIAGTKHFPETVLFCNKEKVLKIQWETFMKGYFVTTLLSEQRILSLLWKGSKDFFKRNEFCIKIPNPWLMLLSQWSSFSSVELFVFMLW